MRLFTSLILCVALLAPAAFGETVTVTASAGGTVGGSPIFDSPAVYTAQLPQFDPALGELQIVELSVLGRHVGTFTITAVSGTNRRLRIEYIDYSFFVTATEQLGGQILFLPWVTEPTYPDPDLPFGGPPGHWNLPITPVIPAGETRSWEFGNELTFAQTYVTETPGFGEFVGTGTLPFTITDWAVFSFTTFGTGQATTSLDSFCGVDVTATYTYTTGVGTESSTWGAVKTLFR